MDLGHGVVTNGWFDTRPTAAKVPMPASLAGKRCLDVGTWDGFWAFEMERRGAESVTAIDLRDQDRWDWPPVVRLKARNTGREFLESFKEGDGAFGVARDLLGSSVQRHDISVYDLDPEVHGTFDFVFLGSLLLHLRDPVAALAALRSVCGDEAVIADVVDLWPSVIRPRTPTARLVGVERPWWWQPNRAGLLQMIRSAGFELLDATGVYILPLGPAHPKTPARLLPGKLRSAQGREELVIALRGIPHTAVRVRPLG
jgi:tRNA (mo5U34)-methyltransferase